MLTPLVTVILPAKDAGPYLATTLATLARQFEDPRQLKVVMVDDGSSDETGEVMERFARQHLNALVLHNPEPVGLASARNLGLSHVEGDYFTFVDGDDWMAPGRLSSLAQSMRALRCDFVRTDHVTATGHRRRLVRPPYPWRQRVVPARDGILPADESTMVDYPYAWAGMLHRRILDEGLADFPEGLFTAEDRPWIWRLHLRAASFAVVDAPALMYRRGLSGSLTQVLDRRQLDFLPAFSQVLDLVEDDDEADRFRPKAIRTVLAVCAHHLFRARGMSPVDRGLLQAGVRELLARFPGEELGASYAGLSDRRRRVLAGVVREVATV